MQKLCKLGSVHYPMERRFEVPFNLSERVIIPRPTELREKVRRVINDGPENFFVFSDFDFTFTAKNVSATRKGETSFHILQSVHVCKHASNGRRRCSARR